MKIFALLFIGAGAYILYRCVKKWYSIMFKGGGLPVKPKPGQTVEDYQKEIMQSDASKLVSQPGKALGGFMISVIGTFIGLFMILIGIVMFA
ncbi:MULTISPECIES: hypothetical protein [Sediminibacterium]|jgi:hypothetical protein|uniref:hypothetical protein n=1 Tax=Sediminibacterium TaxID=504481 RepID=UPI00047AAE68|nr:hypothetical protein [Sediminibacterium salmoneum]